MLSSLVLNKDQPFNLTNLISLDPRMHCANFVWNWQRGSGEHYWTSSKNFYYFAIIFIWKWVRFFIWIICFSAFTFVGLSSVLIRRKCEKFTGNNDKDRQPTNFYQKSSQVLSSGELMHGAFTMFLTKSKQTPYYHYDLYLKINMFHKISISRTLFLANHPPTRNGIKWVAMITG